MELTFKLSLEHVASYRKASAQRAFRAAARSRRYADFLGFLSCVAAISLPMAAGDFLMPRLADQSFSPPEYLAGYLLGVGLVIGVMWWRYRGLVYRSVRPDGPTLSEQRMTVASEGLRLTSHLFDNVLRWQAFEEVSVLDDIIVVWIEPGSGSLVPRRAFADPAAEQRFLDHVRGYIAEARLPRSGTFAP